jgi:LEA14-like dessication related protein
MKNTQSLSSRTLVQRTFIICLLFLVSACETVSEFIPIKPEVLISNISLGKFNLQQQEFIFSLNIDNQNAFSIPISGTEFSIKFAGHDLINGSTAQALTLRSRSKTPLTIVINTQLLKSSRDVFNALKNGKLNFNYELNGKLKVNAASFPIGIPFSKKGNLANDIRG